VGQRAATIGVKFWPGSPSTLGEKVASGLVWRFGTFDWISDNLACFNNGFGDSGSFLDVGGHHFYIAKFFPEEVTDVLDPLCDAGSSCSKSSDFDTMVEVTALGDEEGGDSPRPMRPPLESLPLQEQNAPLPEQDTLDVAVVDLCAPLDHVVDPVQVAEALERTRLVLLSKVAEDKDTRHRMSAMLREFYDTHGVAPDELAHGSRRGHGPSAASPSQIWRPPSSGQGLEGHGRGGHALSCSGRGCAQRVGGGGRACQDLPPAAEPGSQARQPALHVHLWLDHMKTITKGSTSSKRAAADQGGSGAVGGGQGRKEGKYTLDAALDHPCKFHNTPGREATHSTRQCRFIKELEQRAQQLPGVQQVQPAGGQEDHQHEPAAEKPDQGDDDFPAVVEQYHVFTTPGKDKRNNLWYEAEVNAVMPAEP
jgi:hypothetical protein